MIDAFYQLQNVTMLEIELTSYCNAFCGACFRNKNGGELQPYVNLKHMDEETWDSIVDAETLKHITSFNLDGNLGDAAMHPNLVPMLEKLAKVKPEITLRMTTNGGARNTEWWADLARCLQKFKYHQLTFSVDGLEDTNHIYRRNVRWNALINNIKSFNNAGGNSRWRAIIFDHNKHQIKEMAAMAKDLGCFGFLCHRNREPVIKLDNHKNKLPAGVITSPDLKTFNNEYKYHEEFRKIDYAKSPGKIVSENYSCPFGEEGKISIDENGYVWPCCFLSVYWMVPNSKFPTKKYKAFNNIKTNSLEDILTKMREDLYPAWDSAKYDICNNCLHKFSPPTEYKGRTNNA